MKKRKLKSGIMSQVAALFAVGVLTTGILTWFSQHMVSESSVNRQAEHLATEIGDEVMLCVTEYPSSDWLLRYWYEHSGELDLEYDVDYSAGTRTEEKLRLLSEHQPGIKLKYLTGAEAAALPPEDQKLFAEVIYSWLITRVNQIKRTYNVAFLFCVVSEEPFDEQFFLFSAADEGGVRGSRFEEVYTLGTTSSVGASQQKAMRYARQSNGHLADAGPYVDYYAYMCDIDEHSVLVGITYDQKVLAADIDLETWRGTFWAMLHQIVLSVICLTLISVFVLRPLRKVQQNIRLYKENKDSETIRKNLSKVRPRNEIGQLAEDVIGLTQEIDDYLARIADITAEKERIGVELSLATRIQSAMLPNSFPAFPDRKDFDIYAVMDPAREVGGDFYDFFLIDDDHLCLLIADVSGKGVPAALFMMASKIILANNAKMGKTPAEILESTNESVCAHNQEEMFLTVWLGILELSTGRLTAANAGHEYPVLMQPGGDYELYKDKHSFVIGGMPGTKYKEYELQLQPGARLFLYTDGVPEATDASSQLFGTDRMLEALNRDKEGDLESVLSAVISDVDAFVMEAEQFDDLTMLCLFYNGPVRKEQEFKELTVESSITHLETVLDFVRSSMDAFGGSERIRRQTEVVADEVFANISSYAYAPGSGPVTIRVEKDAAAGRIILTFTDQGIPYDPTAREDPDISLPAEEREPGGLGIFLVRKLMDDMKYVRQGDKNVLTLYKKLA